MSAEDTGTFSYKIDVGIGSFRNSQWRNSPEIVDQILISRGRPAEAGYFYLGNYGDISIFHSGGKINWDMRLINAKSLPEEKYSYSKRRGYYQLYTDVIEFKIDFGSVTAREKKIVSAPVKTDSWQSRVDDFRELWSVGMPGTHESACFGYSDNWLVYSREWANCQLMDFMGQLEYGTRMLDLRVTLAKESDQWSNNGLHLSLFHDKFYYGKLGDCLANCIRFLKDHPTEFIILLIDDKNCEGGGENFNKTFRMVADKAQSVTGTFNMFVYDQNVLKRTVGSLRNKIIVMTWTHSPGQYGYIEGACQINVNISNSAGNGYVGSVPAFIQDRYKPSGLGWGEKLEYVKDSLTKAIANSSHIKPYWVITYTSYYTGLIPNPINDAKRSIQSEVQRCSERKSG